MNAPLVFLSLLAVSAGVSLGACTGDHDVAESGSTTGGASGATGTGGTCPGPPPPSPTLPNQQGCYVGMDAGWVAVPCSCELWIENSRPGPATTTVELNVTPPDQVPSLTGMLDVQIAFPDPDASLYATWSKQTGNGDAFALTSDGATTIVRMGTGNLTLAPVPVAACETRKADALISGSFTAKLSLHATLEDGAIFATAESTCNDLPPE